MCFHYFDQSYEPNISRKIKIEQPRRFAALYHPHGSLLFASRSKWLPIWTGTDIILYKLRYKTSISFFLKHPADPGVHLGVAYHYRYLFRDLVSLA